MSAAFEPRDPDYEQRVRTSSAGHALMATFVAELGSVVPGAVEIEVPFARADPAGRVLPRRVCTAVLDGPCGCAAPDVAPGRPVLTVNIEVNLLASAVGEHLRACREVVRGGRSTTVCRG